MAATQAVPQVSIKNTFLDLEAIVGSGVSGCAVPVSRSRSVGAKPSCSLSDLTSAKQEQQQLDRLNTLFGGSREDARSMLLPCESSDGFTRQVSGLKKCVLSSNSISTMAPDDHDTLEDFPELETDSQSTATPSSLTTSEADWKANSQYQPEQQQVAPKSAVFLHSYVPRTCNLAEEFTKKSNQVPATTLMIRNVPNRYPQAELIQELESLGFAGTFDFFYAPIDTGSMGNVGYAFVNFIDAAWAVRCQQALEGYVFKKHQRRSNVKAARVSVAHLQGFEANVRHYEKSAVKGWARLKHCGPVILRSA